MPPIICNFWLRFLIDYARMHQWGPVGHEGHRPWCSGSWRLSRCRSGRTISAQPPASTGYSPLQIWTFFFGPLFDPPPSLPLRDSPSACLQPASCGPRALSNSDPRDNLLNGIATAAADGAPEVEARGQLLIEPEVGFAVGMPTKQDVELQALLRAITTKLADATRQLAQLNIAGTNPTARANRIAVLVALEAASQAGAGAGGDGAGMRVGDLASERRPASFAICLSDATDGE